MIWDSWGRLVHLDFRLSLLRVLGGAEQGFEPGTSQRLACLPCGGLGDHEHRCCCADNLPQVCRRSRKKKGDDFAAIGVHSSAAQSYNNAELLFDPDCACSEHLHHDGDDQRVCAKYREYGTHFFPDLQLLRSNQELSMDGVRLGEVRKDSEGRD